MDVRNDRHAFDQRSNEDERGEQIPLTDQFADGEREIDTLRHNLARRTLKIGQHLSIRPRVRRNMGTDPEAERNLLVEREQRLPTELWLVVRCEDHWHLRVFRFAHRAVSQAA